MTTPNSLGLDFDQLKIQDLHLDSSQPQVASSAKPQLPSDESSPPKQDQASEAVRATETREKKKPYVNTERVKTGGNQRDKLSEEALTERMARMREQNEKIKQRRLDVQADEEAFRKTQESERAKLAQIRKVQENVDRTREQNAKRKMDKIQSREWDSGKPTGDWKPKPKPDENTTIQATDDDKKEDGQGPVEAASPTRDSGGWTRGNSRGGAQRARGRGRSRGGSVAPTAPQHKSSDVSTSTPACAETPKGPSL